VGSCGGLLGGTPMVLDGRDGPPLPAPPRTAWAAGAHPPPRSPHPSAPAHRRPTPPGSKPPPSKAVASVGRIQRAIVAGEGTGRARTALPGVCAQFSTFHGFAAAPPEPEAAGRDAPAKPKRVRPASASASLRLGRTRIRDQQQSEEVFDGHPCPNSAGGQTSSGGKHRILTVRGKKEPGSAEGRSREDDASEIQKLRGQVTSLLLYYF